MTTQSNSRIRKLNLTAAYIDVGELISGVLLFIFIFFHLFFVFTVTFGRDGEWFNKLAAWFEKPLLAGLSLASAAFIGVALLILAHAVLVISRVPVRWQDQMKVLKLGQTMRHFDTTLWFLQAGSGFMIFAFGFAHLWNIVTDLPIEAIKSAEGAQHGQLWFYAPFLILIAIHVAAGFYRVNIKWNFMPRKVAIPISWFLFILYVAVALWNMSMFLRIPLPTGGVH